METRASCVFCFAIADLAFCPETRSQKNVSNPVAATSRFVFLFVWEAGRARASSEIACPSASRRPSPCRPPPAAGAEARGGLSSQGSSSSHLAAAAPRVPLVLGWIEHIPAGNRENDGLETGSMGGCGREISVVMNQLYASFPVAHRVLLITSACRAWSSQDVFQRYNFKNRAGPGARVWASGRRDAPCPPAGRLSGAASGASTWTRACRRARSTLGAGLRCAGVS